MRGSTSVKRAAQPGKRPSTHQDAEPPTSIVPHTDEVAGPSGATCSKPPESVDRKHCLKKQSKKTGGVVKRVRFQTECDVIPEAKLESKQLSVQPLLGYDWIAGVLEVEEPSHARSDEFFDELRTFRSRNKDECVRNTEEDFSEEQDDSLLPQMTDTEKDKHQCTFSYRINSRLFPAPLESPDCCPVCGLQKSAHPHTLAEPALIRTNLPLSTLHPPYEHKPHRRRSYDPSDSLGLPAHCYSGSTYSVRRLQFPPSNLDLRSNIVKTSGSPHRACKTSATSLGSRCKPSSKGTQRPKPVQHPD